MASVATGIATGLGLGLGYGVLSEYTRLGALWSKWKTLGKGAAYSKVAECMQTILSAEHHEVTGLSAKGSVDTIVEFIDKTLDFAWLVDEGIATQMFVQMIQQSIAYAIHSSHAGAIGTIGNVFSGSTYLSPSESHQIGENIDYFDRYLRGFLAAECGQNKPTLTFNLIRGVNRRIEAIYGSMMRNMDSLLDEWNDLALSYYRQYHTMARERLADAIKMKETVTDRAYGFLEQVANEHLARISEQLDTIEGAKAWFDAGLLDADELKDIAIRVNLERGASEANYDDYKDEIMEAIELGVGTWDTKITQAYGDLTDNETKYSVLIKSIFGEMFEDVIEFTAMILGMVTDTIEDVEAYRNQVPAVKIKTELVTIPEVYYEFDLFVDSMNPLE